jgi:hypothetical protein
MRADSPRAIHWGWCPHRIKVRWSEPGSARGTSRHRCSGQRTADLAGLVTSCAQCRRRCCGAVRIHCRRGGASDCHSCIRGSHLVVEPRLCFGRYSWPESTLDRRCHGSDSLSMPLVLGRRWIRAVGGWCSSPLVLQALTRGGALRLLRRRSFEQRLQLLAHSSFLRGCRLLAAA